MAGFRLGWKVVAALAIAVVIIVAVAYEVYPRQQQCSRIVEQGYTDFCGSVSASDGKTLKITIDGYTFAQTKYLNFTSEPGYQLPEAYDVFLVVNVTVQNVGTGNTSMGPLWMTLSKGSGYVNNNTEFYANATIPRGVFPNMTAPDVNGDIYLPPGSTVRYWAWFYVPFSNLNQSGNIDLTRNISLQTMTYPESSYGGDYEGHGGFSCLPNPCQNPDVLFVINASAVTRESWP